MYQCMSGKHWWLEREDAEKCCNGYVRILVLAEPDKPLPADCTSVAVMSNQLVGRRWVREGEEER